MATTGGAFAAMRACPPFSVPSPTRARTPSNATVAAHPCPPTTPPPKGRQTAMKAPKRCRQNGRLGGVGGRVSTAGSGTVHHGEQRSRRKQPVAHPTGNTRGLQRQVPNTAPRDNNISRKRRAALPKPANLIQPLTQQPARNPRTTHRHNNPIRTLRGNAPHAPTLHILTQVPETFPPPIRTPIVRTIQNPRIPHTTIPREVHQPERPAQTPLNHQVGNYSRQQQRPNRVRRGHPHHANASATHNHVPAHPTTPPYLPAKVSKSPEPYIKCGQHRKRQKGEVIEGSTTRRPPSAARQCGAVF